RVSLSSSPLGIRLVGDLLRASISPFFMTSGLDPATSGVSISFTSDGVSSRIIPVTDLPDDSSNVQVRYLSSIFSDGSRRCWRTSLFPHFGSSLVRSGPYSWPPCPPSLWQETQAATVNIVLPLANDRPDSVWA